MKRSIEILVFLIIVFLSILVLQARAEESSYAVKVDGQAYMPAVSTFKALGLETSWSDLEGKLTVTKSDGQMFSFEEKKEVRVDEEIRELPLKPFISKEAGDLMVPARSVAEVMSIAVQYAKTDGNETLTLSYEDAEVLLKIAPPKKPEGNKKLVVVLDQQRIYRYQGDTLIDSSPISSGKGWHGKDWMRYQPVYYVTGKEGRNARSIGRNGSYNVPTPFKFILTVFNGLLVRAHGYHDVPDHAASGGCFRLPISYAKEIYPWVEKEMPIYVFITAPSFISGR